jgi:phosphoribosylaminoimidazolecarboxamide formyltransferase/IMP cyclohydrolase
MPRALVSVSDKTGLTAFASRLAARGWNFLASGGSARALREAGLPVTEVAAYSGSPEILGGRVKTLHPAIHGGILSRGTEADRAELALRGWSEIDLVAVNLYPFEATAVRAGSTEADCVEEIDIGGVALMRAAAKNFGRVCLAADPSDYGAIASEIETHGAPGPELRRRLAAKGFDICTRYDAAISNWLEPEAGFFLYGHAGQELRYGENPHQEARLYTEFPGSGPLGGRVLQGKELSYNNLLDLDAAWRAVHAFASPAAAVVKHLSPCGIAEATDLPGALAAAIACDPVSAYGGVIAVNRAFSAADAAALGELFVECIAAPAFGPEARAALAGRKNCRLLEMGPAAQACRREIRSIGNGFLVQDIDSGDPEGAEWKVVSKRQPTEAEWASLRFAWKAITSVKSNAILLAAPIAAGEVAAACEAISTVGIGSGQPNRVDAARIAVERAKGRAAGSVLASDAFFPFPDSVEVAAAAGVTAIIQPGGSIRDSLSLEAADAAGMAMVITGVRHFRH